MRTPCLPGQPRGNRVQQSSMAIGCARAQPLLTVPLLPPLLQVAAVVTVAHAALCGAQLRLLVVVVDVAVVVTAANCSCMLWMFACGQPASQRGLQVMLLMGSGACG